MKILNFPGLGAALVLAASSVVQAESNAPEETAEPIDTITVQFPLRSPGQATWVTDQLAPGRETGDLLRDLAGVSGSRMGGHGIDPVIRGLGQTRINVLIDGAFVHGACPNRMDPPTAYAPASGYDRITVIRGVNSLEYGGGPGGSVLLERETARFTQNEAFRGQIRASYRSNSASREASVDLAAGRPEGFLRLLAGRLEADDYQDGGGNTVRSAFEDRSASLIAGWTPDDRTRLELSAEAQHLRDELFAGAGMDSPVSDNELLRFKYTRTELGLLSSLRAEVATSRVDHVMDNYSLRQPPSPTMLMRAPARSDTDSARLVGEIEHGDQRWRFGLALQNNARDAVRINDFNGMLNSILWPGVSIDQSGFFVEHHLALSERKRLIAGLRFDRVQAQASRGDQQPDGHLLSPNALYALYYGDQADGQRRTEHNGSVLLRIESDLDDLAGTWYAGLSRTLRTADATERYIASNAGMPSDRWVGNPSLDPERHHQAELGVFLHHNGWDLEASLFYNDIADYILRDRFPDPDNRATIYRNIDARLWGGELSAGLRFADGWRTDISVGYVRAHNRDDARPVAQTPPLEASAGLEYQASHWLAGIRVLAAARQRRVDADPTTGSGLDSGQTPGWAVVHLHGRYDLGQRWRLAAGLDNLFDREYAQHLNRASAFDTEQVQVNEPGRSAWVRLSAEF